MQSFENLHQCIAKLVVPAANLAYGCALCTELVKRNVGQSAAFVLWCCGCYLTRKVLSITNIISDAITIINLLSRATNTFLTWMNICLR